MNKNLALLFFSLLVSYSFCNECEDGCGLEEAQKEDYGCFPKAEGDGCEKKYLCEKVPKPTATSADGEGAGAGAGTSSVNCAEYPVTDKTKYKCETDGSEKACKQVEYSCTEVLKSFGSSIDCSSYSTSDTDNLYCSAVEAGETVAEGDENKACKEVHYCTGNTEGDCTKFKVVPDHSETHVCIPAEEATGEGGAAAPHCQEQYLCEKILKTDPGEKTCSKYILSEENRGKETHTCVDNTDSNPESTNACKEIPYCSHVKSSATEKDCSNYPLLEEEGTVCIPKEGDDTYICQEKYLCDYVPKGTTEDCKNFIIPDDQKHTHQCKSLSSDPKYNCKAVQYECNEVPKITGETTITCSTFLDTTKTETHVCIEDTTSATNQCKEMKLCSKVESTDMTGISDCSKSFYYDKENVGCKLNTQTNKCEEVILCTKATTETEGECSDYATSDENHVCIDGDTTTRCVEKALCEGARASGSEEIQCSTYEVKAKNKDTHICIKNTVGDNPCKEMMLCEKNIEGATDEECKNYPVTPSKSDDYVCIAKGAELGCKEEQLCTSVPKGDNVDCSNYPVKDSNKVCNPIANPTEKACEEIAISEINCADAKKGESDEQCSKYKKSSENKKCIKNTATTTGASPCIEKEISACELKTSGATDDICKDLAVEITGEQKCVKDSTADKCMLIAYCDYAIGNSDADCKNFPLKDSTKECKKKSDANKCQEVAKTTEPVTQGDGEDTKKSDKEESSSGSGEGDTKKSDKPEGSSDSNTNGDGDTNKATETTSETGDKKGNGNFIKVALGLLLMITLY